MQKRFKQQAPWCLGTALALMPVVSPGLAAAPSWQPVGQLTDGRILPPAILLEDGSVLVVGGEGISHGTFGSLASAERFDPQQNTFTLQGAMKDPRTNHTAVRLQDGRVLVLGGEIEQADKALASAEIYDPATGQFTPTGSMTTPRDRVRATRLSDGRVLVVGGVADADARKVLATAETYDPETGTFQATGSLAGPRSDAALVNLPDGRVAVLGGTDEKHQPVLRVEIYDPETGHFAGQGQTQAARVEATPVLLAGGKILLAGGLDPGGQGHPIVQNSIEVYDPATGQSTLTGTLTSPRDGAATAALSDGRVLVAGGWLTWSPPTALATAELIDPATGQVSVTAPMPAPSTGASAVRLQDGRVLVLGGAAGIGAPPSAAAEVFLP